MKILSNGIAVIEDDSHISKWVEETGRLDHDQCMRDYILPIIKEGQTVVDVGAFIGDHTIAYANKVGITGKITAIEPNDKAFACLVWNTHHLKNVTRHCCFVDCNSGMASLKRSVNAGASFLEQGYDVIVTTLDELCPFPIHFLKIDAEGMELRILLGAKRVLKEKPTIVCEINVFALSIYGYNPHDIYNFMESNEYQYSPLTPDLNLDSAQFDLVCTPKT